MSKSRRISAPGRLNPGVGCRLRETRTRWRTEPAAAAAVRGHIWVASRTVNSLFQKIGNETVIVWKRLGNPGFLKSSGRLDVSSQRLGFGFDPLDSVLHQIAERDDSANLSALDDRQMPHATLGHGRQRGKDRRLRIDRLARRGL